MDIFILNTGGTLGMVGRPLRPAKTVYDLMQGINVPKGMNLKLVDFPKIMDSTNIMHKDRLAMGNIIKEQYNNYDSFVVFHGTDSMAETTSFFCMLFKNTLQKPIFVIGAQMTKDEPGTEVPMQIANTLRVSAVFVRNNIVGVYNVCIGDVLDGSRLRKRRDSDFQAFYTPGRDPVAQAWPNVLIRDGVRKKDQGLYDKGLHLDQKFESVVATFKVTADTPPWILMDIVKSDRLKGVILECKGTGHIPDRVWQDGEHEYSWIDAIKAATEKNIHVGIMSPFEDGRVILDRYELGQMVKDAGGISLESLTPDMADIKFRQAIASYPSDPSKIQEFISTDFMGELLPGFEEHN